MSLKRKHKKQLNKLLIYIGIFIMISIIFWPILWMIISSLKTSSNMIKNPPQIIPSPITLEHFAALGESGMLLKFYINSIIVSSLTVVLSLLVGIPASYIFSRFKFKGSNYMLLFFLASQMIPWTLLVISLYIIFFNMHLINTYLGLILAHTTLTLPFIIWMMKGFFDSIPRELEEAAYVDGCGRLKTLTQIIIPVAIPGVITAAIYSFLVSWSDLLFGLTLMNENRMRTLPAGIAMSYIGEFEYQWGDMMAAALAVSVPVIIIFMFLQNYLVKGLTAGALKE